jgi:hypothetical protein
LKLLRFDKIDVKWKIVWLLKKNIEFYSENLLFYISRENLFVLLNKKNVKIFKQKNLLLIKSNNG